MQQPTKNEELVSESLCLFHYPAAAAMCGCFGYVFGCGMGYLIPDAARTVWLVASCLILATVAAVAGYIPEELKRKGIRDELARRAAQSGKR
jgi:hypothetical protein